MDLRNLSFINFINASIIYLFIGSVEHRAQVAVYCLLMRERHKVSVNSGLLYYIKTNHMQQVPIPEQEKRAIIIKRNEIARRLTLEKEIQILPGLFLSVTVLLK